MAIEPKAFVPEAVQVFNESSFYEKFLDDVRNAKGLVILQSPFISRNRWSQLSGDFRSCVDRQVSVCIFLQDQGDCAEFLNCLGHLENAGVHVNIRPSIHEKIAIIDEKILWDGSLNVLSHRGTRERMSRFVSREMVLNAILEHRINKCDKCETRRGKIEYVGVTAAAEHQLKSIGRRIQRRRLDLDITQSELSNLSGVSQQTISHIENGSLHNVSFRMVCTVCQHLDLEIRAVPWFFLPMLDDLIVE